MTERELGLLGFGDFGRFAARHLADHFDVVVADRRAVEEEAREVGVRAVDLREAASRPVVVLAVPVQAMEELLEQVAGSLREGALVIEVASVKRRPTEILEARLPDRARFLGLHPMFGPQSGRDGIEGLRVVLCRSSSPLGADELRVEAVRSFLAGLGLEVLEMSADRHDREMAYIQGLTHWIAKALREIHLPDLELATPAYRHLVQIEEILRDDSQDLFLTIQRENPHAPLARAELLRRLREIEEEIDS